MGAQLNRPAPVRLEEVGRLLVVAAAGVAAQEHEARGVIPCWAIISASSVRSRVLLCPIRATMSTSSTARASASVSATWLSGGESTITQSASRWA